MQNYLVTVFLVAMDWLPDNWGFYSFAALLYAACSVAAYLLVLRAEEVLGPWPQPQPRRGTASGEIVNALGNLGRQVEILAEVILRTQREDERVRRAEVLERVHLLESFVIGFQNCNAHQNLRLGTLADYMRMLLREPTLQWR